MDVAISLGEAVLGSAQSLCACLGHRERAALALTGIVCLGNIPGGGHP